jgi:hypothetical protein
MPFTKIRASMTQNGASQAVKAVIFEGEGSGPSVTIEGGPFSGQRYTREDLLNLAMLLQDLSTTMQEVADGAKI